MWSIAIVDDSCHDQKRLEDLLHEYSQTKDVDLNLFVFENASAFFDKYRCQFDLIFMDIEMPSGESGLDVAKKLLAGNPDLKLIITSSFPVYAVAGYDVNAISFLTKPIERTSFFLSVDKALDLVRSSKEEKVLLSNRVETKAFLLKDIVYFESFAHVCICYTSDGGEFSFTSSIKELEKRFKDKNFFRIKSSYLVNLAYVKAINGDTVIIKNARLTISRRVRKEFVEAFTTYIGNYI